MLVMHKALQLNKLTHTPNIFCCRFMCGSLYIYSKANRLLKNREICSFSIRNRLS